MPTASRGDEERHRHRFEVNNDYRDQLEEAGLIASGISPDGDLVEIMELRDHPFFVGVQFHPEFKSRPNRPHPIFRDFIGASSTSAGRLATLTALRERGRQARRTRTRHRRRIVRTRGAGKQPAPPSSSRPERSGVEGPLVPRRPPLPLDTIGRSARTP